MNVLATETLQREVHDWANATFPGRQPAAAWLKLFEELGEVIKTPHDRLEWADVFIMLFDLASMHDVDVEAAVLAKLEVNRAREWRQLESGVFSHITDEDREAEDEAIALANARLPRVPTDNNLNIRSIFEDGPYESEVLGGLQSVACTYRPSDGAVVAWAPEDGSGGCYVLRVKQVDPITAGGVIRLYYRWNADGVPF